MATVPRVLVINGESDTEAVLKAVLEPRGARVDWSRQTAIAASLSHEAPPEVVIIDLDDHSPQDAMEETTATGGRILIGSQRIAVGGTNDLFLEKPFQFPELISAIEGLLASPIRST